MLALTRKTDYAIVALAHMAQQGHGVFTAREISERFHMPLPLLMNILKSLCHGELVRSTRGVKGGYSLAMPAAQITLDSIIRVVEGPVHFVQCATDGVAGESCDMVHTCPVTRPIRKIHAKLKEFLNSVTLAQIANDEDYGVQCIPLSHHGAAVKMER